MPSAFRCRPNAGVEVHCHFKVDTGMGRIGFSVRSDFEAAIAAMERCAALPKLHFSGISSILP